MGMLYLHDNVFLTHIIGCNRLFIPQNEILGMPLADSILLNLVYSTDRHIPNSEISNLIGQVPVLNEVESHKMQMLSVLQTLIKFQIICYTVNVYNSLVYHNKLGCLRCKFPN